MPRAKRSIKGAVTIEGFSLIWNLHREQQAYNEEEWKGVGIHVRIAEGVKRELHLEYPVKAMKVGVDVLRPDPARQNILTAKVEAHIREAMAAGWDPGSRGKPFVHKVEELPG
jgi:hypothetical protein